MVIGNANEADAVSLLAIVAQAFPFQELPVSARSYRRIFSLPTPNSSSLESPVRPSSVNTDMPTPLGYILSHKEPNPQDENSACTFYFQLPTRDISAAVQLEILADAIEQPFYDELRTKQQLGYIVSSGVRTKEGYKYLTFTVQSSLATGHDLIERIESFLADFFVQFQRDFNEKQLDALKSGIKSRKLEPDQSLTSQATRLWSEIIYSDSPSLLLNSNCIGGAVGGPAGEKYRLNGRGVLGN
eukprot:gene14943-18904_t